MSLLCDVQSLCYPGHWVGPHTDWLLMRYIGNNIIGGVTMLGHSSLVLASECFLSFPLDQEKHFECQQVAKYIRHGSAVI